MLFTLLSIKCFLLTSFAVRPTCFAANMAFLSFCIARAKSCVMYTSLCLAEDFSRFLTKKTASLSSLITNLAMILRTRAQKCYAFAGWFVDTVNSMKSHLNSVDLEVILD